MTSTLAMNGLEDAVNGVVQPVTDVVSKIVFYEIPVFGGIMWIVAWLVVAGIVFTVYFKGLQVRAFKVAYGILKTRGRDEDRDAPGEISQFQALMAACSATVGLGNIAGVAVAVTIGGPGAAFWMLVCGLLGMSLKFAECTLGVKYRERNEDGSFSGGPMHYLRKGLAERGLAGLGKVLAAGFAPILIVFGLAGGVMFQTNQSVAQLQNVTGGEDGALGGSATTLLIGIALAAIIGAVLFGGAKRIGAVVGKLVPAMGLIYVLACLMVLGANAGAIPGALGMIVREAFSFDAGVGGFIGVMFVGFMRAAFSSEAGLGAAPIVHASAKTRHPAKQGLVAMLGPFIDTVVICSMTALAIIIANPASYAAAQESGDAVGVTLTSDAFATALPWFPYVLALAVCLFAISTAVTWSFYGQKGWEDMFGRGRAAGALYKAIVVACAVLGSVVTLTAVLDLADAVLFILAVINILGLYLMAPVVKAELKDYMRFRAAARARAEAPAAERIDAGAAEDLDKV
ncbi:alanine/glycine:cation symporter family protein [Streptomyces coryli]|nr:alanine/glycine:cation symporter family protein [Streptomyces coryli]